MVTLALVCLCVQNTALILSMRYSRSVLQETYLSSTAIVMMELFKCLVSYCVIRHEGGVQHDLMGLLSHSLPMLIPSAMYVMQNSLQFLAITHLDASTFAILSQLKILTTAVCSVLMLGTHLSFRKWRGLMLLVIGAILVQYPEADADGKETSLVGLAAVLGMVCLSGLAGIYLEKYLKNSASPKRVSSHAERREASAHAVGAQPAAVAVRRGVRAVLGVPEGGGPRGGAEPRLLQRLLGLHLAGDRDRRGRRADRGHGGQVHQHDRQGLRYQHQHHRHLAHLAAALPRRQAQHEVLDGNRLRAALHLQLQRGGEGAGGGAGRRRGSDRKLLSQHANGTSLLELGGVNGSAAGRGLYKMVPDSPPNEEEQQDELELQARK